MRFPDALIARPSHRRVQLSVGRAPADHVDPLELFERLYGHDRFAFLYESLEAHGGRGRYSFLGGRPALVFKSKSDRIDIESAGEHESYTGHPVEHLRALVSARKTPGGDLPLSTGLPSVERDSDSANSEFAIRTAEFFHGGAVGYFSYDMIRFFETLPARNPDPVAHPDAFFLFPDEIVVLDHRDHVAHIILYRADNPRASEIEFAISSPPPDTPVAPPASLGPSIPSPRPTMTPNMSRAEFERSVERAKAYIHAGDIFQVVLSQRFAFDVPAPPIDLYRALRITNPSPYMYYLNLDGLRVLGSSPEALVKLDGRNVTTKPLAGTRRRGTTPQEDQELADELRADPKERAEHVMLVDLARNDIGKVCEFDSVNVIEVLGIERYSKVMHLVSSVEGVLSARHDAFDLVAATFPAGTVSGAPKIRAMQIIDELEPEARGVYAGAIGYITPADQMDLCIGIRTIVVDGDRGYIQAGAGVVADSNARREYQETLNKAAALFRAVELAAQTPPSPRREEATS